MPPLITGFEPFGPLTRNVSADVVAALEADPRIDVVTAVLPVSYADAGPRLCGLIDRHRPSAVLMLGVHRGSDLRLETTARNRDRSTSPDNRQQIRDDHVIAADGPPTYPATLPLPAMVRALEDLGLPHHVSDDAGGYLCNHGFYAARHHLRTPGTPVGFLHLPDARFIDLDTQVAAVRRLLALLTPR